MSLSLFISFTFYMHICMVWDDFMMRCWWWCFSNIMCLCSKLLIWFSFKLMVNIFFNFQTAAKMLNRNVWKLMRIYVCNIISYTADESIKQLWCKIHYQPGKCLDRYIFSEWVSQSMSDCKVVSYSKFMYNANMYKCITISNMLPSFEHIKIFLMIFPYNKPMKI